MKLDTFRSQPGIIGFVFGDHYHGYEFADTDHLWSMIDIICICFRIVMFKTATHTKPPPSATSNVTHHYNCAIQIERIIENVEWKKIWIWYLIEFEHLFCFRFLIGKLIHSSIVWPWFQTVCNRVNHSRTMLPMLSILYVLGLTFLMECQCGASPVPDGIQGTTEMFSILLNGRLIKMFYIFQVFQKSPKSAAHVLS